MTSSRQTGFLVLEGLDGAGTTTQARLLAEALRARGVRVVVTAEPTDGWAGRVARAHVRHEISLDPVSAALAFTADRADHLDRVIRPALASGAWVVSDRYLLSTLAYQGAGGVDPEWVWQVSSAFEVPDLTLVLDVEAEIRADRMAGREAVDRYEGPEMQKALAAWYERALELLRRRGHRIAVVDGSGSPEEVLARLLAELDRLGSGSFRV